MKQETQNKFAEILAAAQKQAGKSTITQVVKQNNNSMPEIKPDPKFKDGQNVLADIYTTGAILLTILYANSFENGEWVYYCTGDGQHYVKESKLSLPPDETPKEFTTLEDITNAANNGEVISLSNLADLVNDKPVQEAPKSEIEGTFLDLIDYLDGINKPVQIAPKIQIVDYSEKAICVTGEGTREIKEKLKSLGGRFNRFLTIGAGWIFAKRHLALIESELNLKLS